MQVPQARQAKLGFDHRDTLYSMYLLALTWRDLGRRKDSLSLMEDCLQRSTHVLGESHEKTLRALKMALAWRREG